MVRFFLTMLPPFGGFGHLEAFYLNKICTSGSRDNGLSRETSKTQLQNLNNKLELIHQKVGKSCLTTLASIMLQSMLYFQKPLDQQGIMFCLVNFLLPDFLKTP